MNPVHILLAISVAANAALGWAYLNQRDTATEAKTEQRQAVGVAMECSKGTDELEAQASKRKKDAGPKRQAAADKADAHNKAADQIMTAPPAVPGDACASAQAVLDDWWQGREKP